MIGKTISHYKILEKLGEGGMGVVYKAEDTKLRRTVALKFLSSQALGGEDEKPRFIHEAQAAASLTHSNICHVYEIDESDGQTFIAMECVDGRSLKDKIESGPLKLGDAMDVAAHMAEGLSEAHAKGIVHRDIKPANIMITPEGKVKIMDFGLAKSDTRTVLTKAGTTLGTAAYMSPEQARGEKVDHRTDIWSLGVVIYEMVTGQRAFKGDYEQAVLYSILNQQPEPMTALRTGVPIELERIVSKAMSKDPSDRYQHVDELPVDLRALKARPAGISTASAAGAAKVVSGRPASRSRGIVLALGWLIAGAIASGLAVWGLVRESPPKPQPVTRFAIVLSPDQKLGWSAPPLAISPDGTLLAYAAQTGVGYPQLYLRPLDRLEAVALAGTERASDPFFSPDGRWVGFFAENKLKKVSVAGGMPVTISDAICAATGASWGSDDTIVFPVSESSGLVRVSASGGVTETLTTPDRELGEVCHRRPHVLPGGEGVLFTKLTAEGPSVSALNLRTGELHTLMPGAAEAVYLPTGHLICAAAGALRAVPFDPARLEVTGPAVPVLDGISNSTYYGLDLTYFAISQTGTIAYVPSLASTGENALVWVDREGKATPLSRDWGTVRYPKLSPDGARIAVTDITPDAEDVDIWIYDIGRGTRTRLTSEGNNVLPVWTPDGERVTFGSNRSGSMDLYWKASDGSGGAQRLLDREYSQFPESWSPDGRTLAFTEFNPRTGGDILMLHMDGDHTPKPFVVTPFVERSPRFSPNGRLVAYSSNESGRYEIYVRPYPGPGGKWTISTEGGTEAVWSPDGRELYYCKGDQILAVTIETEPEFRAGKPRFLFEGRFGQNPAHVQNYDVSADGKRFVMVKGADESESTEIHVVLNWSSEIEPLIARGDQLQETAGSR